MDINTPKGRETLEQVADAINIWRRNFPKLHYIHTPANMPADIDGIIAQNGRVIGVVEVKCRVSMSVEAFDRIHNSEWLVTFDKVTRCIDAAKALQVPFVGFLYFPREKMLFSKTIFHPIHGMEVSMRVEHSTTQATVNGGKIARDNAYIDMSTAKRLT